MRNLLRPLLLALCLAPAARAEVAAVTPAEAQDIARQVMSAFDVEGAAILELMSSGPGLAFDIPPRLPLLPEGVTDPMALLIEHSAEAAPGEAPRIGNRRIECWRLGRPAIEAIVQGGLPDPMQTDPDNMVELFMLADLAQLFDRFAPAGARGLMQCAMMISVTVRPDLAGDLVPLLSPWFAEVAPSSDGFTDARSVLATGGRATDGVLIAEMAVTVNTGPQGHFLFIEALSFALSPES